MFSVLICHTLSRASNNIGPSSNQTKIGIIHNEKLSLSRFLFFDYNDSFYLRNELDGEGGCLCRKETK